MSRSPLLVLVCLSGCVGATSIGQELGPDPVADGGGGSGGEYDDEGDDTDFGDGSASGPDSGPDGSDSDGDPPDGGPEPGAPQEGELPLPASWELPPACMGQDTGSCVQQAVASCGEGEPSWWRAEETGEVKLWVAGVYQTRSDHAGDFHPEGTARVDWSIPGRNVVVVSSYEPTHWTIALSGAGQIERIVATGYHQQRVDGPAGVPVEISTYEGGDSDFECGYAVPGDGGGCEGERLAAFAQDATGLPISGFDGCYHATDFFYAE